MAGGHCLEEKISRADIVYQDRRTGAYVNSPVVANGAIVTVPVINVPRGGAFRKARHPDVVPVSTRSSTPVTTAPFSTPCRLHCPLRARTATWAVRTTWTALGTVANKVGPGSHAPRPLRMAAVGIANATVERTVGLGTNRRAQFSLRLLF
jgi:hypothetical protein